VDAVCARAEGRAVLVMFMISEIQAVPGATLVTLGCAPERRLIRQTPAMLDQKAYCRALTLN
jgi:hypothetical protein